MKVALIQTHIKWEDKEANLQYYEQWFTTMEEDVDLVVFQKCLLVVLLCHLKRWPNQRGFYIEMVKKVKQFF